MTAIQTASQDEAHTKRWLHAAGIRRGMRVLDVGAGRGLVAMMVAERVGPEGLVIGIERESKWVEHASERARDHGLQHARFVEGDFQDPGLDLDGRFDAVVGRRVLKYQADAVQAVRSLVRHVQPKGVIAFLEMDGDVPTTSSASLPLHDMVRSWIWRTIELENADTKMGRNLYGVFQRAGLQDIHVQVEGVVHTPNERPDLARVIRFLLPRIVASGIATEEEIAVDTLQARLDTERAEQQGVFVSELVFGAWAHVP
jgi:ubiquinone/menaquinone biosynthesis C-methylase UbiE